MKDWDTLPWVISALGDLGYDVAIPYLVRLVKDKDVPQTTKAIVSDALLRLNVANVRDLDPAQLYYNLAERFYSGKCSVAPPAGSPVGFMWAWNGTILDKKDVPAAVFNEDMALRCCEYVLALDPSRSDAVSLWLLNAFKREVEMPEGAVDPTWDDKQPSAHFFAVQSGTGHLNATLSRAPARARVGRGAEGDQVVAGYRRHEQSLQRAVGSADPGGHALSRPPRAL